jgi:CubicO group peptidase (beta-lactamase class C family)
MRRLLTTLSALSLLAVIAGWSEQSFAQVVPGQDDTQSVDAVFQKWNRAESPGCVVGVDRPGAARLIRSYGSEDLEHDVPNTESTVLEAGSVSKQFTAAAILTLADRHKIRLSDDVRTYLPELPDYGAPITIAELLGHTSGLRDWGEVEGMAGWPRTTRIYTLDEVLDIAARQKHLNYPPGTAYSYTNTGYNLLAIIVARVSGQSLAQFTHANLFVPLGMTQTQWRDDFTRVVKDRAIAYVFGKDGYHQEMPFENAYGNGGLLTTVDDLLTWNRALTAGALGKFVTAELQRQTLLNGGRPIAYARGLFVQSYHGVREVSHSGATAGYRAWLGRYPDQNLSIALLCNAGDADVVRLAHSLADLFLPKLPPEQVPGSAATFSPSPEQLTEHAGLYFGLPSGLPLQLTVLDGALRVGGGPVLAAQSANAFTLGASTLHFTSRDHFDLEDDSGGIQAFDRIQPWHPTAQQLTAFVGRYSSDETVSTWVVSISGGKLALVPLDRGGRPRTLTPVYENTFELEPGGTGAIGFSLDSRRQESGFDWHTSRVYSLHFARISGGEGTH